MNYAWPTWVLFRRDFVAPLQGTAFGIGWNLVLPLVPISAYVALRAFIAPGDNAGMHAAVYVALGVTMWMLLADTLTQGMSSMQRYASVISNSSFPVLSVLIASWGRLVYEFALRLILCLVVMLLFLDNLSLSAFLAVPVAMCGFLLAAALGVIFLVLRAMYPDIEQIVQVVLRYLIFLSGAIFPLDGVPYGEWLYRFNPFAIYVETTRSLAVTGACNTQDLASVMIMTVVAVGVAAFILRRCQAVLRSLA
jgi:ABC-type polysaccharide/polyol phosphate export permease